MSIIFTNSAPIGRYTGFLQDVFDHAPKAEKPENNVGTTRYYGSFRGQKIRIDIYRDGSAVVWGRSDEEARSLARRVKRAAYQEIHVNIGA